MKFEKCVGNLNVWEYEGQSQLSQTVQVRRPIFNMKCHFKNLKDGTQIIENL